MSDSTSSAPPNRPCLMVIFGAGASHDSISGFTGSASDRPPLTKDLFTDQDGLQRFLGGRRAAKGLVAEVVSRLDRDGETFEDVLSTEYEATSTNPMLRRSFTALRFYLRDLFRNATESWPNRVGGATNYEWFVRTAEKWRFANNGFVVWVTFNYDGLLDQALEDLYGETFGRGGPDDPQLAGFLSHPDWAYFKLHGSYDWRRKTAFILPSGEATNDEHRTYLALEAQWDAGSDLPNASTIYQRANGWWSTNARGDRSLWVPALMAPLARKSSFELPPAHLARLVELIPTVDFVLTLGWRAEESHFMQLLSETRANPPDVLAVTGSGISTAIEVADRLVEATSGIHLGADRAVNASPFAGFSALRREVRDFDRVLGDLVAAAHARRFGADAAIANVNRQAISEQHRLTLGDSP